MQSGMKLIPAMVEARCGVRANCPWRRICGERSSKASPCARLKSWSGPTTHWRSNRELKALAYIASHDLKEPLRGVQDYARFVLQDSADRLHEEAKGRLRTVLDLTAE